jgi:hypothetical protein
MALTMMRKSQREFELGVQWRRCLERFDNYKGLIGISTCGLLLQKTKKTAVTVTLLAICASLPAWAHIGPPYPIMQDRKIGMLTVSVWANPDVGTGSFFIVIDPPKGSSVPSDIKVQVAVQPVSGRMPEKTYDAWHEKLRNRVEFKALVPFDKEEMWRIRIRLASAEATGETQTDVSVTPTLLGRWDLLLFLLPFLGIAALWLKAVSATRSRRKKRLLKKTQANAAG